MRYQVNLNCSVFFNTENGLDHQLEPSSPPPGATGGDSIITRADRDNLQNDIDSRVSLFAVCLF